MYGEKIAQLRKDANMTQGQLGELLNVSPQAVSKWEHDLSEPDLITAKKIANLFNISLDEFLGVSNNSTDNSSNDSNENVNSSITEEEKIALNEAVATTVATTVASVVNEKVANKPETLGYCVKCGCIVTNENKGILQPKVLCKNCYEKVKLLNQQKKAKQNEEINEKIAELKKKNKSAIIWGCVVGVVIVAFALLLAIFGAPNAGTKVGVIFAGLFLSYAVYALISEIKLEGPACDFLDWFLLRTVRMPGVIFELSLDGLFFLIFVKILFGVISFLIGLLFGIVGVVLGCIITPFTYPITITRYFKKLNELKSQIK